MRHRSTPWVQGIRVSLLVCSFIILVHGSASAAIFCVSTAADLASALLTAKNNGADDVIRVVQGTYQGTFVYSSNEAFSLTIEGGYVAGCTSRVVNPANTVLDAMRAGTVLTVSSTTAANFVVNGLTLQKGLAGPSGGLSVDMSGGDVTLTNNVIRDNTASGPLETGSGVSVRGSTITLVNNTISQNITDSGGSSAGGAFIQGTTVTLTNNVISQNTAFFAASGGVYVKGTMVTLINNITLQRHLIRSLGNRCSRSLSLTPFGSPLMLSERRRTSVP